MNAAALTEALVEHGLNPSEIDAKRRMFDLILDRFAVATGHPPRHVWWVPGRLEVFGKHTDYAGGRTLVAAVPRGFSVAARPRADGRVTAIDARTGDTLSLQPRMASASLSGWHRYVEVVANRIARNFPGHAIGADIVFASDLPPAAGMSSSSALMVAVATALVRVGEIAASPAWQSNIRTAIDAAGYFGCVENGSRFGTLEGDAGVGTHGGSEDHAAILTSDASHLTAFSFVPMREIRRVRVADAWRFVIAPSGVIAEKTGGALGAYNRLSEGARLLLALWNTNDAPAISLGAALASQPDAVDRLRDRIRRSGGAPGWATEALARRLDHFVREDARIAGAADAFAAVDRGRLEVLSDGSQADAEHLLGNQVPETIALARQARELGAFGACSFGAGFGGSVWALVEREHAADLARRWHPSAFVADPGPRLTELTED